MEQANNDLSTATNKLDNLKFFQITEKKETNLLIEKCHNLIETLKHQKTAYEKSMDDEIDALDLKIEDKKKETRNYLDKQYRLPAAPVKPRILWTESEIQNQEIKEKILELLTDGSMVATEIASRLKISLAKTTALLYQLMKENKIEKQVIQKISYWGLSGSLSLVSQDSEVQTKELVLSYDIQGKVTEIAKRKGDRIRKGETIIVILAVGLEIPVEADEDGIIQSIKVVIGQTVSKGSVIALIS